MPASRAAHRRLGDIVVAKGAVLKSKGKPRRVVGEGVDLLRWFNKNTVGTHPGIGDHTSVDDLSIADVRNVRLGVDGGWLYGDCGPSPKWWPLHKMRGNIGDRRRTRGVSDLGVGFRTPAAL